MTENRILKLLFLFSCFAIVYGHSKTGKAISVFNIVKFANDRCNGTDNKYGTCYTEDECEDKGGKADGSCAEGYGVCCTFTMGCGDSKAENSTYFESNGASSGACNAEVCRCNKNICQFRLDFTAFQIAGPSTDTTTISKVVWGATEPAAGGAVSGRGRCDDDHFAVSVAGGANPPVICGTNTDQHMYIDVPTDCATLSFHLSATNSAMRQWNIQVSQYECDYENLAPKGCTQYYFGESGTGTIESFNFNGGNGVHLANQDQLVCVRREKNMCKICWTPNASGDFRVSKAAADTMGSNSDLCGHGADGMAAMGYDHIIIPQPLSSKSAVTTMATMAVHRASKFCGSTLALRPGGDPGVSIAPMRNGAAVVETVCSRSVPFNLRFLSDNYEVEADVESQGFRLKYSQESKCENPYPYLQAPVTV